MTKKHTTTTTPALAIRQVRASAKGSAYFETPDDADAFASMVVERFDPAGYGTSITIHRQLDGSVMRYRAEWYVGSAE